MRKELQHGYWKEHLIVTEYEATTGFQGLPSINLHACDNILALHQALDTTQTITNKHPKHDLLFALQHKMRQSKVQWSHTHVRGHQVDKKLAHKLNRLELLNIKMDELAKTTDYKI
jgi:hypothetical protein